MKLNRGLLSWSSAYTQFEAFSVLAILHISPTFRDRDRTSLRSDLPSGSASDAEKCKPKNWGPGPKFTPLRGLSHMSELLSVDQLVPSHNDPFTMANKFSEEKLMAVAEINAKRSAFYCAGEAGEAYILSAAGVH